MIRCATALPMGVAPDPEDAKHDLIIGYEILRLSWSTTGHGDGRKHILGTRTGLVVHRPTIVSFRTRVTQQLTEF